MITVFSIESDQSTNQVIDWLDYFNVNCQRINAEDFEADKILRLSNHYNGTNKDTCHLAKNNIKEFLELHYIYKINSKKL